MAVTVLNYKFPGIPHVTCVFQYAHRDRPEEISGNISFKYGDRTQTIRSREELLASLPGLDQWAECDQVHGNTVLVEPEPTPLVPEYLPEADGMMTSRKGFGLLIKTADCQPVLVTAQDGKHIMALHVGWRGSRAGFIPLAIELFCQKYDVNPGSLAAVRGPSLGPAAAEFVNFQKEWDDDFRPWYNERDQRMDLWALTVSQLEKAGLRRQNIHGVDLCTFLNFHNFFSYRKDRHTGRQASLIWINS